MKVIGILAGFLLIQIATPHALKSGKNPSSVFDNGGISSGGKTSDGFCGDLAGECGPIDGPPENPAPTPVLGPGDDLPCGDLFTDCGPIDGPEDLLPTLELGSSSVIDPIDDSSYLHESDSQTHTPQVGPRDANPKPLLHIDLKTVKCDPRVCDPTRPDMMSPPTRTQRLVIPSPNTRFSLPWTHSKFSVRTFKTLNPTFFIPTPLTVSPITATPITTSKETNILTLETSTITETPSATSEISAEQK